MTDEADEIAKLRALIEEQYALIRKLCRHIAGDQELEEDGIEFIKFCVRAMKEHQTGSVH